MKKKVIILVSIAIVIIGVIIIGVVFSIKGVNKAAKEVVFGKDKIPTLASYKGILNAKQVKSCGKDCYEFKYDEISINDYTEYQKILSNAEFLYSIEKEMLGKHSKDNGKVLYIIFSSDNKSVTYRKEKGKLEETFKPFYPLSKDDNIQIIPDDGILIDTRTEEEKELAKNITSYEYSSDMECDGTNGGNIFSISLTISNSGKYNVNFYKCTNDSNRIYIDLNTGTYEKIGNLYKMKGAISPQERFEKELSDNNNTSDLTMSKSDLEFKIIDENTIMFGNYTLEKTDNIDAEWNDVEGLKKLQ